MRKSLIMDSNDMQNSKFPRQKWPTPSKKPPNFAGTCTCKRLKNLVIMGTGLED